MTLQPQHMRMAVTMSAQPALPARDTPWPTFEAFTFPAVEVFPSNN